MDVRYKQIPKAATYELIIKAQNGDEEAKTLLIENNGGLVRKIAQKFTSLDLEMDDIVQIGYMGLLKAIYKFDISFDVMFSTYAVPIIIGEIKRYFRDNGKIKASRELKNEICEMKRKQEAFIKKNGRDMRISELSEAMNITPERVVEILEATENLSQIKSLDNLENGIDGSIKETAVPPDANLERIMIKEEIRKLPARERQIMVMRYYKEMTQSEIGKVLGMSQVQVSRIEKKVISAIKSNLLG